MTITSYLLCLIILILSFALPSSRDTKNIKEYLCELLNELEVISYKLDKIIELEEKKNEDNRE